MDHKKLIEKTRNFLDVATYQENPLEAKPIIESPIIIESRIDNAVSHLDRMFGFNLHESTTKDVNSKVNKEIVKYSQGRLTENCCEGEVVYTGSAKTGVKYTISKKAHDDFLVSFERPNGGKAELASYSTAQGALYMLQSQVPSLEAIKDDISHSFGVEQDSVNPIETHSFDDLHENTSDQCNINVGDTVQTIKQGQQRGTVEKVEKKNGITKVYHRHEDGRLFVSHPTNLKIIKEEKSRIDLIIDMVLEQIGVNSLDSLNENTQKEIISIATDLAPHI